MYTDRIINPIRLALALSLVVAACGDDGAEQRQPLPEATDVTDTPAELGLGDDWYPIDDGLWTRVDDQGDQEFLGLGAAGKRHALTSLAEVEEQLARAAADGTDESRQQLTEIRDFIAEYRDQPVVDPSEDPTPRCTLTLTHTVSAYPIACGVAASASVYYSHPCSTAQEVKTYTKATCGYMTATHQCGPQSGNPVSCSSYSEQKGSAPCDSYALAQSKHYSTWKVNTTRGACSSGSGSTSNSSASATSVTSVGDDCPSPGSCHEN